MISIGEMSRRSNVKVPTIRFYEQKGLISAPERSEGNQRRYTNQELQRLSFIRHARDLGLTIDAIRELIELSDRPEESCAFADEIAAQHLEAIQDKINQLKKLEKELQRIVSGCDGESVKNCYVIQSLASHDLCTDDHN
jgi:DNA-binding transcriptional MerR regulator